MHKNASYERFNSTTATPHFMNVILKVQTSLWVQWMPLINIQLNILNIVLFSIYCELHVSVWECVHSFSQFQSAYIASFYIRHCSCWTMMCTNNDQSWAFGLWEKKPLLIHAVKLHLFIWKILRELGQQLSHIKPLSDWLACVSPGMQHVPFGDFFTFILG